MKTVLAIAGSDPSGGAGIEADLKTITVHKMYGMCVITAITAQNTLGVQKVYPLKKDIISAQLESVLSDITPDAIKIGEIADRNSVKAVLKIFSKYNPKNIVCDPCMISTSGHRLIDESALSLIEKEIFPKCSVITPNIPEAEYLLGEEIKDNEINMAAERLNEKYDVPVLVKGGHGSHDNSSDFLCDGEKISEFPGKRIDNPNTHGTGCTFSSAIACNLANGYALSEAIKNSKNYISGAIGYGLNLGHGRGPLFHAYSIN